MSKNFFADSQPISRRTLLRGTGVALALPALEALCPGALRADEQVGAPRRLVAIQSNQGIMPQFFFPEQAGRDYEPSPYLKIFQPLREDFTVFSGLSHPGVDGGHANEQSFLTGAPHPAGAAFRNSVSLDQIAAEQIGGQTRFGSLTIAVCNGGNSSMSYTRSGVMIPAETSATRLYRQLFVQGSETEIKARLHDLRSGRSLLDTVHDRARRLAGAVTPSDRRRLDQYFTAIRELEQQFLQSEEWEHKPKPQVDMPEPPENNEASQLMTRLQTMLRVVKLALVTDSTRIVSLFVQPLGVLSEIPNVSSETHSLTHHGNRPEMISELRRIEERQLTVLCDFLTALREVKERDETLLDRTSVLYGTCMGNANGHTNSNWPMMLFGGGFQHGQHLAFDVRKNEPIGNLYVTLLQRMGLEMDKFASSTGTLRGLEMT